MKKSPLEWAKLLYGLSSKIDRFLLIEKNGLIIELSVAFNGGKRVISCNIQTYGQYVGFSIFPECSLMEGDDYIAINGDSDTLLSLGIKKQIENVISLRK